LSSRGWEQEDQSQFSRPAAVRLWRRATDPLAAPVIFETKSGLDIWASIDRMVVDERVWCIEKSSFPDSNIWIGDRTGPKTRLVPAPD
jgi:prolyl oligopeptidase